MDKIAHQFPYQFHSPAALSDTRQAGPFITAKSPTNSTKMKKKKIKKGDTK